MIVGGSPVKPQIRGRWSELRADWRRSCRCFAYLTFSYMFFIGTASRKDYKATGNKLLKAKRAGPSRDEEGHTNSGNSSVNKNRGYDISCYNNKAHY